MKRQSFNFLSDSDVLNCIFLPLPPGRLPKPKSKYAYLSGAYAFLWSYTSTHQRTHKGGEQSRMLQLTVRTCLPCLCAATAPTWVWIKQFLVTVNRRLAQYMLLLCLMWLSLILEKKKNLAYLKERVKLSTYHIKIFQGAICFFFIAFPFLVLMWKERKTISITLKRKALVRGQGSFRTIIFQPLIGRCNLLG